MNSDELKKIITRHEGLRLKPYRCSAGKLTIGIGHNLDDRGVSEAVADLMYQEDVSEAENDVRFILPDFHRFSDARQHALIDMRFQLGYGTFRRFKRMLAAISVEDWAEAARQVEDSSYFKQVPARAKWVRDCIKNG